MDTRKQDCLREQCLFSARHAHKNYGTLVFTAYFAFNYLGCKCITHMDPPVRNPIRLSNMRCPTCRDGGLRKEVKLV